MFSLKNKVQLSAVKFQKYFASWRTKRWLSLVSLMLFVGAKLEAKIMNEFQIHTYMFQLCGGSTRGHWIAFNDIVKMVYDDLTKSCVECFFLHRNPLQAFSKSQIQITKPKTSTATTSYCNLQNQFEMTPRWIFRYRTLAEINMNRYTKW